MQPFTIQMTPRSYETDAMGHINNASIAAWLEVVRVRFLESLVFDGDTESYASVAQWILASVHIDYLRETHYGPEVTLQVTDLSLGNSSLTLDCRIAQNGEQTVAAKAVLVRWDATESRSMRIEDDLRNLLSSL